MISLLLFNMGGIEGLKPTLDLIFIILMRLLLFVLDLDFLDLDFRETILYSMG